MKETIVAIIAVLCVIIYAIENGNLFSVAEKEKPDTRTPITLNDNVARQIADKCMEQYINETQGYKASIPELRYVIKKGHRPIRYEAAFDDYWTLISDDKDNLCQDFYTFTASQPKYYTGEMHVYCCKPHYNGPSLFNF